MAAAPTIKSPFYMPRNSVQVLPTNAVQNRLVEKTRAYGGAAAGLSSSVASADVPEPAKVARVEEPQQQQQQSFVPMQQEEESVEVQNLKKEVEEALKLPLNAGRAWTVADQRGNLINMVPRSADVNLAEFQKLFPHLKPIDAPIDFTGVADEKKAEHEESVKKARAYDLDQAYKKYLLQKENEQQELRTQALLEKEMKPLIDEANRKRDYDPLVEAVRAAAKGQQSIPVLEGFQSLVLSNSAATANYKQTHSALEKQLKYTNELEFKNKDLSKKLAEQEKRIKELEAKVPKVQYYASQVESTPRLVESASSKRVREEEMEEDTPENFIRGVWGSSGHYTQPAIDTRAFAQSFAQNIAAGYGAGGGVIF